MLLELAAANAAFAVIKESISAGGDIMSVGQHIFKFLDSKSKLSKKANASGSDSEAFFALEQIKNNEKALQEMFIYQGRPGLWDDWLQFQADAKRKRESDAKAERMARIKRKEKIWGWVSGIIIAISVATGLFVVALLIWAIYTKGQL